MTELERGVLDDVLELHHVVGRGLERGETVVDLLLSARTHLVVGTLDGQPDLLEDTAHLVANIRVLIGGGHGKIPALEANFVPHVAPLFASPRVPIGFGGVHLEEGGVRADLVAHVVEQVELGLGADETLVGDPGGTQVGLGLRGHLPWVTREGFVGEGVDD